MGTSNSVLHASSRHDDLERFRKDVEKGRNYNAYDMWGALPIHYACGYGSVRCLQFILSLEDARIDAREKDQGNTALHCCISYRHYMCVQMLLEKGARVDIPNRRGDTALHIAAETGQDIVVAWLLRKGASPHKVNRHGQTPIRVALGRGYYSIANMLGRPGLQDLLTNTTTYMFSPKLTQSFSIGDANSCSVCLTEYEEEDEVRELPCKHQFHKSCVDLWLERKTVCPTCRFDLAPSAPSLVGSRPSLGRRRRSSVARFLNGLSGAPTAA